MDQIFRYAVDGKFRPLLAPVGFRPSKDGVTLSDDGRFLATFGFFRIDTRIDNVAEAISTVKPFGVDLCTGVRVDGRLHPERLDAFMSAVAAACA